MEFHELANIFPVLSDGDMDALCEDIRKHGQHEPIAIFDGKIIDGRNRFIACERIGIEPKFINLDVGSNNDALNYVISMNLTRRHLTSSQRAAVAIDAGGIMERLRAEAKARQGERKDLKPNISQQIDESSNITRTDTQAAKLFDTNRQYINSAKKIKGVMPEKFEEIKQGKTTITKVEKEMKKQNDPRTKTVSANYKRNNFIHTETHIVSDAMRFAGMAIAQLESIKKNDPERGDALVRVENWIISNK